MQNACIRFVVKGDKIKMIAAQAHIQVWGLVDVAPSAVIIPSLSAIINHFPVSIKCRSL